MLLTCWETVISVSGMAWRWMTRGSHWKIVAAAITVALFILFVFSYRASLEKTASLTDDLNVSRGEVVLLDKARVNDNAAVEASASAKDAIAKTEAIKREATDKALKANANWANEPIPLDVVRSLQP